MHIKVRAQNPGHEGRYRAGRKFANGTTYDMEVVDGDDPIDANGNLDMARINRPGFEKLKGDPMFSILSGDAAGGANGALVDAARKQASETAGKLSDALLEVSRLTAENEALRGQIAELQADGDASKDDGKGGKHHDKGAVGHKR